MHHSSFLTNAKTVWAKFSTRLFLFFKQQGRSMNSENSDLFWYWWHNNCTNIAAVKFKDFLGEKLQKVSYTNYSKYFNSNERLLTSVWQLKYRTFVPFLNTTLLSYPELFSINRFVKALPACKSHHDWEGKNQYPEWIGKQKRHNRIYDVLSIQNAELLSTVWKASWPVNELVCQAAAEERWQKELAAWLNWCGTELGGEQQELLCGCLQSPTAGAVLRGRLQHGNGKRLRGACLLLPLCRAGEALWTKVLSQAWLELGCFISGNTECCTIPRSTFSVNSMSIRIREPSFRRCFLFPRNPFQIV